jgi:hypothetical protein
MRKLLATAIILSLAALPALADTASKKGEPVDVNPATPGSTSLLRSDWEYNTGGSLDFVPTTGGSHDGWGEWFLTCIQNNTGYDVKLMEFGFPCCGPATGNYGWVVWLTAGYGAPAGTADTADFYGGPWSPVDPSPDTFPPTTYTYLDVSAEGVIIPNGGWFVFGYDVTGNGGQTTYNGVETWAWYSGYWDSDVGWSRTAILQFKADYWTTPVQAESWSAVKSLF